MPIRRNPRAIVPKRSPSGEFSPFDFEDIHRDFPREGVSVVLTVQVQEDGRPSVREVRILSEDDRSVTATDIRAIPLGQLVSEAMAQRAWSALGTEDTMRVVSMTYYFAALEGEDALAAVARRLGVSRTTAATRVREARAAGYLPARARKG